MMKRRFTAILLTVILLFCPTTPLCLAADSTLDIMLTFQKEVAAENTKINIYKVAHVTADGKTELENGFDRYSNIIESFPDKIGREAAATVAGYAQYYGTKPFETVYTDKNGKADFEADENGIYLIVGETYEANGKYIEPSPVFFTVTGNDNLAVELKSQMHPINEKTDFKVKKVWEDAEPSEGITCILLANGVEKDRVVLSEKNNWSHTWDDINYSVTYSMIEEDVPSECYISVNRENDTFILTNKGKIKPSSDSGDGENESDKSSGEKLAQTGLLWWPIPLLIVSGAIFVITGTIITTFSKSGKDGE